jgi:undecaprenyl diphosphate synthase
MMKSLPNHVAIIPDGNRRWAKAKELSPFRGHEEGVERASELLRHGRKLGIHTITFWGLSTENLTGRSPEEVSFLSELLSKTVDRFLHEAKESNMRFVHLGRTDRLAPKLLERLRSAQDETRANKTHVLNLAVDYGGHDEILRAVARWRESSGAGESLNEEKFAQFLDTNDEPYPNPDFVIRTSGEMRTSGLMPWQIAYSELFFEKSLFPDFTVRKFDLALAEYTTRQRRFGA